MNNAKAQLSRAHEHKAPVQPRPSPRPSATVRADDAVRDFFKRGDRGQYEGGAADKSLRSVSTWDDLPDRPRIVRTKQQQARRAVLTQLVATVMVACLVLLVTAARLKSRSAIEKHAEVTVQNSLQPTARLASTPTVDLRAIQPALSVVSVAKAGLPAISPAQGSASAAPEAFVASPRKAPKASAAQRPTLARLTESNRQPLSASTSRAPAPQRAVAAFPDD